jgi:sensor histidine kinase regulating citrate/malate metabolism
MLTRLQQLVLSLMKNMNKSKNTFLLYIEILLLAGVVVSGYFATNYMAEKIETDERSNLLLRAQTVASIIDTQSLATLKGTSTDSSLLEHSKLKQALEKVHAVNKDTRFVYILGQRDNSQFFYVDAEPAVSKDYSAPGEIYTDALASDKQNYIEKIAYTKGPYTDAWGNWFSAFAPITESDGTMLGQLVMDIDSEKLLLRITIVKQATIIIFTLIFLSVLVVGFLVRDSIISIKK